MATQSPTLVQMLLGVIPAEDGATLVARMSERPRITSSAGTVDVSSVSLTAEAINDLSTQLLRPEDLQTLRDTGAVRAAFVATSGEGEFEVLASATDDNRCVEVRRQSRSTTGTAFRAGSSNLPSAETLVSELLARRSSNSIRSATLTTPTAAINQMAVATQSAPPAVHPDLSTTPSNETPVEANDSPSGSDHDLDVPANLEFADSTFDADDLTLPGAILDEPATGSSGAESAHSAPTQPASVGAAVAARTIPDRPRADRKVSALLAAGVCAVIGLPAVSWFAWTRYVSPAHVSVAPTATVVPTSQPPAASPPHTPPAATPEAHASPPPAAVPAPVKEPPASIARANAPVPAATDAYSHGGYSIQVAAVRARDEAERMTAKLVQRGYSGYVVNGEGAAADFYRVRIGGFADRQAAEAVASQIELAEGIKPWIVRETR